jgi:hypothetical protein
MPDDRDFSSYDDRDQRRSFLYGAVVLGAGAALAIPAVRKGLITNVLKGIEYAGNHLATVRGPVPLRSAAAQLTSILERQLPRAAELSIGLDRARGLLEGALAQFSTAEVAAVHAGEIVEHSAFRNFLTSGRRVEELLDDAHVGKILGGRISPAQLVHIRDQSWTGIEETVANSSVFQKAQQTLHGMARTELERQSRWKSSVGGQVLGWFGIRPTTLGEIADSKTGKQLLESLASYHDDLGVLHSLPLGGVFHVGGQRVDLRGAKNALHEATSWFRSNFQIPLAPGAMGINPLQLFPWRKGGMTWNAGGKVAAHIPGYAFDPAMAAHLGGKGGIIGKDVFQVGRKFASVDFLADIRAEAAAVTTSLGSVAVAPGGIGQVDAALGRVGIHSIKSPMPGVRHAGGVEAVEDTAQVLAGRARVTIATTRRRSGAYQAGPAVRRPGSISIRSNVAPDDPYRLLGRQARRAQRPTSGYQASVDHRGRIHWSLGEAADQSGYPTGRFRFKMTRKMRDLGEMKEASTWPNGMRVLIDGRQVHENAFHAAEQFGTAAKAGRKAPRRLVSTVIAGASSTDSPEVLALKAARQQALDDAVQVTDLRGELRSSMWGFMRHRTEEIRDAMRARGAAPVRGSWARVKNWLGLGNHKEKSIWGRAASILGKYEEGSDYAPVLMERILSGETARPGDVRRAGHYLTSRGLSAGIAQEMGAKAEGLFSKELAQHVRSLGEDQSVLGFFMEAAAQDPKGTRYMSSKLSRMVNEFRANPSSVIGRIQPGHGSESLFGWNFLGKPGEKRGFQLMREAILDEIEEKLRVGSDTGFVSFINKLEGVSAAEKEAALAYGRGKVLLHHLESGKGAEAAADWLKSTKEAQEDIGRFVRRTTHPHEVWSPREPAEFGTAELFVQKRFSFMEEMNRHRVAGKSVPRALIDTVTGGWGRQYAAAFTGNQKDVTSATLGLEYFPRRLNEYLQEVGVGLPDRDLLSGGSIMANLMLKRIAPAVAGVEAYRYLDHAGRSLLGFGPSDAYANLRAHAGMHRARHAGKKILGIRRELLPGLDKYISDRDENEEWEHQQSGYEPVRKGRFWSIGSRTEFIGEKINYYAPSAVQTARSDWQSAENADLNTHDYWRHSWIPNPDNLFLGPLASLHDTDWWEKKHAAGPNAERPYLTTGTMFDPNTVHGPLFNATIGRILKPREVLHPEYLPQNMGGSASREELRQINEVMKQGLDQRGAGLLVGGGGGGGVTRGTGGVGGSGVGSPGVIGGGGEDLGSLAVMTPAGQLTPVSIPAGTNPSAWGNLGHSTFQKEGWGKRLSRSEIERINRATEAGLGGGAKLRPGLALRLATQSQPFSDEDLDMLDHENGTLRGLHNVSELAGLYGFFGRTAALAAGLPIQQKGKVIANANRAYGFARRWYDLDLGGLGGSTNELGRRFLTRPDKIDEYNPVPNRMPSWLPGSEYFLDLKHGDPYTKIPRGEIRLPGEAYERVHHEVNLMHTRASSLGKSVPELMRQMLFLNEPMSAYGKEATEQGTIFHHQLQSKWKRMGILIAAENRIENEKLGISGHFDAILATQGGPTVVDIKTVNDRRYQQSLKNPFQEHISQVNYYLHETGVQKGAVLYVNRDKPWQVHTHEFGFSQRRFNQDIGRVQEARSNLMQMVKDGTINRGDLYDPISRFEIVADVAPYSENYTQLREYLVDQKAAGQLSDEENKRFQSAKKRVAQQKKRVTVYPNRFRGLDLDYQTVTVDKILDPNTFTVRGSDNPIRLAGVRSSQERIHDVMGPAPEGKNLAEWQFEQFGIHPGSRIKVGLEGDPMRRIADDTLKTQHAVVFGRGGNVNRQLIESGVGTEKETDYSDTGVAARFSNTEIRTGKFWEWLAHLDTPINSKFMRVRTAKEELERGIVYGKSTGGWQHPFRDYVTPTFQSYVAKNPIIAGGAMGTFATFFWKTPEMKVKAFAVGAAVGAGAALARSIYEHVSGKVWKPGRTRKREELEEYWDTIKYIKLRGLVTAEGELAQKEEGVDVDQMTREVYQAGEKRKRRTNWLEKEKRRLILDDKAKNQDQIKEIQQQLNRLAEPVGMMKLGPHATKALQLRELYRSTLYGYTEGAPFLGLFRAFPKYKRELITQFIEKSDEGERQEIFNLLPRAEQRALGGFLGIDKEKIPERPKLTEYFAEHPLPGPDWAGWRPDVDLEQLRQRAIEGERLDPFESGIYPQQIEEAKKETANIPVPTLHGSTADIQGRLNQVLSGRGLKGLRISVDVQAKDGDEDDLHVAIELKKRREQDLRDALQTHG